MTRWLCLLGAASVVACSERAQPVDGPLVDLAGDGGVAEGRPDLRRDAGVDQPTTPPHWEIVPGVSFAGEYHTMTLLADGDVLIVGGHNANRPEAERYLAEAWRFKVATATLESAGKLATGRSMHTATRLADGRVLVVGGDGAASYLASSELYDPGKPPASAWSAGGPLDLPETRSEHAAVALPDGRVLVCGGHDGNAVTKTVFTYDGKLGYWKTMGAPMTTPRRLHSATLLVGGKVLLAGGLTDFAGTPTGLTYDDTLELVDLTSGTVSPVATKMSHARVGHTATRLLDGRVVIVGGYCGPYCTAAVALDDVYDPATGKSYPLSHMGKIPSGHVAALFKDGRLVIVGSNPQQGDNQATVAFTPGVDSWEPMPKLAQGRGHAQAVTLADGSVLVAGGTTAYDSRSPDIQWRGIVRFGGSRDTGDRVVKAEAGAWEADVLLVQGPA